MTDTAPRPAFSTVIRAIGSDGNVYSVLATATQYLKQLDVPPARIEQLRHDVLTASSYDQALVYVERWFPVDKGDER